MDENKNPAEEQPAENSTVATEYEGMSKGKATFIKLLPMLITLACVGLFAWGIKWVAGIFYAPDDFHYTRSIGETKFNIVWCEQQSSNTYYVYDEGFTFNDSELDNVGAEHTDAHQKYEPLVYFTLNIDPLDVDTMKFNILIDGNGLYAMQIGEFVVYRLEGEYGVFAPLREYKESATSRKNDLYVVKQLLKKERYLTFDLPETMTDEDFLETLEKLEWKLETEYDEDD